MRAKVAGIAFYGLRALERCLTPELLYWTLLPLVAALVVLDRLNWRRHLKAVYGEHTHLPFAWGHSFRTKFNRVLPFFPDRLPNARWLRRCEFVGLDRLMQMRQPGQPLILAFTHFGAFPLLGVWLRAAGIPASTLIAGKAFARTPDKILKDRVMPFPEVPMGCYYDHKRQAIEVLSRGHAVLIAVDFPSGKLIDVPVAAGRTFTMAPGGMRLAARLNALLVACLIVERRRWRFCVEIGEPTPPELLAGDLDLTAVGRHLYGELQSTIEKYPEQHDIVLQRCFTRRDPDQVASTPFSHARI